MAYAEFNRCRRAEGAAILRSLAAGLTNRFVRSLLLNPYFCLLFPFPIFASLPKALYIATHVNDNYGFTYSGTAKI